MREQYHRGSFWTFCKQFKRLKDMDRDNSCKEFLNDIKTNEVVVRNLEIVGKDAN